MFTNWNREIVLKMCVFCKHLIKTHKGLYGVNLKACSEGLYEILVYLIDVLKLRADVLLFPQTLTDAPIGRGKDDFVWPRNTATQKHSYLATMLSMVI